MEAVLTSTHNLCFEQKYEKYQSFLSEIFQFLEVKFSIYLNRLVFVMNWDLICPHVYRKNVFRCRDSLENKKKSETIKHRNYSPISNPKPDLNNINAHTKFGENRLIFTQVIIRR